MKSYHVDLTFRRTFTVKVNAKTPAEAIKQAKHRIFIREIKLRPKDSIKQEENARERI